MSQVKGGVMVATRLLDKEDPTYRRPCWQKINPHSIQRTWYATAEARRKLTQWVGFAAEPAPQYRADVTNKPSVSPMLKPAWSWHAFPMLQTEPPTPQ